MNFSRKAVEQALTVNHSQVVWFKQVTDAVPDEILVAIGRAPKIGRPRWLQFAEVIAKPGNVKKARAIILTGGFLAQSSDDRFSHLAKELTEKKSEPAQHAVWADPKGRKLASFTYTDTKCTVQIDRRDDPDFAEYLYSKLGDITAIMKLESPPRSNQRRQEPRLLPFSRQDEITQTRIVSYSCNIEYRVRGSDLISYDFGPIGFQSLSNNLSNLSRSGLCSLRASSVGVW